MIKDDYKAFINQNPSPTKIEEGVFFIKQIQFKGVKRKDIISAVSAVRKIQRDSAKLRVTRAISIARKAGYQFDGKPTKGDKKMDVAEQSKNVVGEVVTEIVDEPKEELISANDIGTKETELAELAAKIRNYAEEIRDNIIDIGICFIQAKKQVKHGEWDNWVEQNTTFSRYTAYRFMQCAKRFKDVAPAQHLNSTQMMELLALPAPHTEAFFEAKAAEGNPVKDMSKKKLREEVKAWNESHADDIKRIRRKKEQVEEAKIQQESVTSEQATEFKIIELRIRAEDETELIKILNDVLIAGNNLSKESKAYIQQVIDTLSVPVV